MLVFDWDDIGGVAAAGMGSVDVLDMAVVVLVAERMMVMTMVMTMDNDNRHRPVTMAEMFLLGADADVVGGIGDVGVVVGHVVVVHL